MKKVYIFLFILFAFNYIFSKNIDSLLGVIKDNRMKLDNINQADFVGTSGVNFLYDSIYIWEHDFPNIYLKKKCYVLRDINGRVLIKTYKGRSNPNTNTFKPLYQIEYTYENNKILERIVLIDYLNGSRDSLLKVTTYNSLNLPEKITEYKWKEDYYSLVEDNQTIYIYDFNGIKEEIHQKWNELYWENDYKIINYYDGSGLCTIFDLFQWNSSNLLWENYYRYHINYENNKVISDTSLVFLNNKWNYYQSNNYSYDIDNKWKICICKNWNTTNNLWENSSKTIETYNEINKITLFQYYIYENNNWTNYFSEFYQYDTNNNIQNKYTYYYNTPVPGNPLNTYTKYKNENYFYSNYTQLKFEDQTCAENQIFNVFIKTKDFYPIQNITSIQFDFEYDNYFLDFLNAEIYNFYIPTGQFTYNLSENKISIRIISTQPMANYNEEDIILIQFRAKKSGIVFPRITNCYFNNKQVTLLGNGKIDIKPKGDVDYNQKVQAFDAAITLQYSVGLDPIPEIDNRPWSYERYCVADVNSDNSISALDASLILNLSYLENKAENLDSTVKVEIIGNEIVFISNGKLLGFNVYIEDNFDAIGNPEFCINGILNAQNISKEIYNIGIASDKYIENGVCFLKIPLNYFSQNAINLNLIVNSHIQKINLLNPNGLNSELDKINIYPNPTTDYLNFNNLPNNSSVYIFDVKGNLINFIESTNDLKHIDVSSLSKGMYFIKINNNLTNSVFKFVKE